MLKCPSVGQNTCSSALLLNQNMLCMGFVLFLAHVIHKAHNPSCPQFSLPWLTDCEADSDLNGVSSVWVEWFLLRLLQGHQAFRFLFYIHPDLPRFTVLAQTHLLLCVSYIAYRKGCSLPALWPCVRRRVCVSSYFWLFISWFISEVCLILFFQKAVRQHGKESS